MTILTLNRAFLLCGALALAGCATTNGPGNAFQDAPNAREYATMSAEEREAAAAAVQRGAAAKKSWWIEVGLPIYLSGEPVSIGNKQTGRTLMWDPLARVTYIYAGHTNGPGGIERTSSQAFKTDEHGNPLTGQGQLLANVSTQEGIGRFASRLGVQAIAPMGSGLGAAAIHANNACDENCGDSNLLISQSSSESTATGTGSATAGSGCPSGGCGRDAFKGFGG